MRGHDLISCTALLSCVVIVGGCANGLTMQASASGVLQIDRATGCHFLAPLDGETSDIYLVFENDGTGEKLLQPPVESGIEIGEILELGGGYVSSSSVPGFLEQCSPTVPEVFSVQEIESNRGALQE